MTTWVLKRRMLSSPKNNCLVSSVYSAMSWTRRMRTKSHSPATSGTVGSGTADGGTAPLHSRDFDFNDAILGAGIDFFTALVTSRLPEGNRS